MQSHVLWHNGQPQDVHTHKWIYIGTWVVPQAEPGAAGKQAPRKPAALSALGWRGGRAKLPDRDTLSFAASASSSASGATIANNDALHT